MMEDLQSLRGQIDEIDRQLVELFRQRMDVTRRVGLYKQAHHLPVLDQERERQVLRNKGSWRGRSCAPPSPPCSRPSWPCPAGSSGTCWASGPTTPPAPVPGRPGRGAPPGGAPPGGVPGGARGVQRAGLPELLGPQVETEGLEQFEDAFLWP